MGAGGLQQAGCGHGALAVTAHHHSAAGGLLLAPGQVAELNVNRAGDVAGGKLGVLPDVQHGAIVDAVRADQFGRLG